MKKTLTGLFAALIVVAAALMSVPLKAQDFQNDGGSYNATCNAVIKMKENGGVFDGTAPIGEPGSPIPGIVDWSSSVAGQQVQARDYTNLFLSGNDKVLDDGIVVVGGGTNTGGALCATPAFAGYGDLDNGYPYWATATDVDYDGGIFNFEGPSGTPQNIFGDTYATLNLDDQGQKNIATGDIVFVDEITSDAATPLDIAGTLNLGPTASNLAGDVTVDGGLINALDGNESLEVGSLTLTGVGGTELDFQDGTNLIVNTSMINNDADGTNVTFTCNSTVEFTAGATNVMPTVSTNSYGNLVLTGGDKQLGTATNFADNIYVCTDFSLSAGDLTMSNTNGPGTLFMNSPDGDALYGTLTGGTGIEEVIGSMNRTMNNTKADAYVFNNAETSIILDTPADTDNPDNMTFYVNKGQSPQGYAAATDVDRKVQLSYNGNAGAFEWTAEVGYRFDENPTGGWDTPPGPNSQERLRMYEADGTDGPTDIEKLLAGIQPTVDEATGAGDLGSVTVQGIGNTSTTTTPNEIGLFASNNDIVLRTGPTTFYSIADGRWTNPATWDEGTHPTSVDNVEIRHAVYVGIDGPFIGTTGGAEDTPNLNTQSELNTYNASGGLINNAANDVLIINDATNYPNSSLIVGNEDNGSNVFTIAGDITNQNNGTTGGGFPYGVTKGDAAETRTNFNGIWLINSLVTGEDAGTPAIGATNIINTGTVNNEGIIELGN